MGYNFGMDNDFALKIQALRNWLGRGSINIFGLPMSGKDTVGVKLAEAINGKFLSSGLIIRAMEAEKGKNLTGEGKLIDTNLFYDWVLPYFSKPELAEFPLVLSSIGRWKGEEDTVIEKAKAAGHEIKAAIVLNVSEADVTERFKSVTIINDRGNREDDKNLEVFMTRIQEFREKTAPVLLRYRELGLLVEVKGDMDREIVFSELVEKLYAFSQKKIMDERNLGYGGTFF